MLGLLPVRYCVTLTFLIGSDEIAIFLERDDVQHRNTIQFAHDPTKPPGGFLAVFERFQFLQHPEQVSREKVRFENSLSEIIDRRFLQLVLGGRIALADTPDQSFHRLRILHEVLLLGFIG